MSVVIQTQNTDSAADEPLLAYQFITTPSPLKASSDNPQVPEEIGELIVSVARQSGTPTDVEWIKVKVPAGTMAPDLATDLAKISPRVSLTGWTVRLDTATKEFVCAPAAGHTPIGPETGFTIQLSDIPISRKVGTAPITITERSRTGSSAFQNRTTVFNLGKFPADFHLRNFLCEPSIIPNGGDVKLTWERSANATYELLYGDVNRDVTNRTSLDIEGIRSDTTFYLRATTGDPTNPVTRIISAQVTVTKPDLEVANLAVSGDMQIAGKLLTHQVVATHASGFWLNTRAETDGILVATVERGDAYVDVGQGQYFLKSLADGHRGFVSLPVLKGAIIRYKISTGAGAKIEWYGFGTTSLPSPWP